MSDEIISIRPNSGLVIILCLLGFDLFLLAIYLLIKIIETLS